jgi:hypothetical protein
MKLARMGRLEFVEKSIEIDPKIPEKPRAVSFDTWLKFVPASLKYHPPCHMRQVLFYTGGIEND